jgi:zinc protease
MILDRTQKPLPKTSFEFNPPKIDEIILNNGLKIYFVQKEKLPLIRLNLVVDAGSKFDPENKKGLAYLTALVIDEGADNLNALELSDEFDLLGSDFNVSADNDSIILSLQCLSENFEKSFQLFSKVLLSPAFNEDDLEREKKRLITQIIQSKDEPDYLADQIFNEIVLGVQNNYSSPVMGYDESVRLIEKDDVLSHYKNLFSPSNSFLVIVGDKSKQEFVKTIEKYLTGWKAKLKKPNLSFETYLQGKKIFIYNKKDSVQTEIRVGHVTKKRNSSDYFQKLLLNAVLGGQFTSRINLNLRERNGYTYGASSRFQYFKDAGIFQVATSVGTENTGNALKEILFELENIKNGISDQELEFAKSSITKKFPMNFETYRQIVYNVSAKILFDLPSEYFETYIENINKIEKIEIEKAAIKSIKNDELAIVLVGDSNLIKKELSSLEFEIIEVNLKGEIIE